MFTTRAFSILELIIAFSVLSITLVFGLQLYAFNQDALAHGTAKEKLLGIAVTAIKTDFDSLVSTSTETDGTTLSVIVNNLDPFIKLAKIKASRPYGFPPRSMEINLERTFYDMGNKEEQSSCSVRFNHTWNVPIIDDSISLSGSSTATSIKVQEGIAYVGANSPKASDPDLYIFDVSDPGNLRLLSTLNTGPGVMAVSLSWPNLFLANTSINSQLQIVDVSYSLVPTLKTSFKLPGSFNDNSYVGNSIAVNKNIIALGTRKSADPELHFIDISDTAIPVEQGYYELNAGVNAIWLSGIKAYVATPLDEELITISLKDISNPTYLGGFNADGLSGNGKSLYKLGTLYLGRTIGRGELLLLQENGGEVSLHSSTTLNTSINSIFVRDSYIFLGTIDPQSQFQIWKMDRSLMPQLESKLELSGKATGIDCDKETIFVTTSDSPSLYSITASL